MLVAECIEKVLVYKLTACLNGFSSVEVVENSLDQLQLRLKVQSACSRLWNGIHRRDSSAWLATEPSFRVDPTKADLLPVPEVVGWLGEFGSFSNLQVRQRRVPLALCVHRAIAAAMDRPHSPNLFFLLVDVDASSPRYTAQSQSLMKGTF